MWSGRSRGSIGPRRLSTIHTRRPDPDPSRNRHAALGERDTEAHSGPDPAGAGPGSVTNSLSRSRRRPPPRRQSTTDCQPSRDNWLSAESRDWRTPPRMLRPGPAPQGCRDLDAHVEPADCLGQPASRDQGTQALPVHAEPTRSTQTAQNRQIATTKNVLGLRHGDDYRRLKSPLDRPSRSGWIRLSHLIPTASIFAVTSRVRVS